MKIFISDLIIKELVQMRLNMPVLSVLICQVSGNMIKESTIDMKCQYRQIYFNKKNLPVSIIDFADVNRLASNQFVFNDENLLIRTEYTSKNGIHDINNFTYSNDGNNVECRNALNEICLLYSLIDAKVVMRKYSSGTDSVVDVEYYFDNNKLKKIDEYTNSNHLYSTEMYYDENGNIIEEICHNISNQGGKSIKISYSDYDKHGNWLRKFENEEMIEQRHIKYVCK